MKGKEKEVHEMRDSWLFTLLSKYSSTSHCLITNPKSIEKVHTDYAKS